MKKDIVAVRGAVTVDENNGEAMVRAVGDLMKELERINRFQPNDIISIQFTQTVDLNKKNAAASLRASCPEYAMVPLFCAQEPTVEGLMPKTIRILVTWRGENPGKPVYLGKAAMLRPDLLSKE